MDENHPTYSFEVVSEQNESVVEEKVPRILRRGVRRVFGVFLKAGEVREWMKMGGGDYWQTLAPDARIVRATGARSRSSPLPTYITTPPPLVSAPAP
jgi:hypothetical protein